jgi:uncharacterized Zn finger protein
MQGLRCQECGGNVMDPLPNLTEAIIRQHASADSYLRGREYYEQGAVLRVVRRGQQFQAEVEGSQYEPYRVQITYDAGGIAQAVCSCPFDWGGWCKHIVATLLACVHDPAYVDERPSMPTLLAGLNGEQLQALLLRLVEFQPELADVIEGQVQRLQIQPVGDAPALRQRRTPIDPDVFRRQVRSILRSLGRMRASEAYWHVSAVVDEVRQVLEQVKGFVAGGDGRNALAILEAITETYITDWVELDDSDGEAGAFFEDLGAVCAEAILVADPSIEERRTWAEKLARWQHEVEDYGVDEAFEAAMAAAEQGWDYPPLVQVLQGKITDKGAWEAEAPFYADTLAIARLNVLERQERYQEYLYLAEAEGQTERYVTMLARLGRVQEAVDYGLQYLGTTDEALALATALRGREEHRAALQIAEHGLHLEGSKAPLATWVADLALGMGESGHALDAALIAFREAPELAAYQRVKELAGERWPELQRELLAYLRQGRSYYPQGPVEIFLHEGLVEDAMRAVESSASYALLEQVVDAAIPSHAEWAIQMCRQQAESIMNQGKSQYYHHAARWLEKARAAYRTADRETEWATYLAELMARHRRKYSLIPMLETLKRSH